MSDESELRQQREALNTALNNHDLAASTSFLHPDFVAQGNDGHAYNRKEAVQQLEQMLQPSMNLQSQIEVEHVEVSGDSATLRVCRTESGRMDRPGVFWGCLALAAYLPYEAIETVYRSVGSLMHPFELWSAIVVAAVLSPLAIWAAFHWGRRSMHQTQRAQETWRRVDGRWLLAEERQLACANMKTRKPFIEVAVAVVAVAAAVGAFAWAGFPTRPGQEFQRSGNPSLKLEVRRASTKEVDGWKFSTTPDDPEGKMPLHVLPDVELSNADVLSTRAHFQPNNMKPASRWKGGATFLVFSVVLFVVCWRSKDGRWWFGVPGAVCLLVGGGSLWHGLTSTAERFEQQGSWQVVIRFNEAGTKKLADLTAQLAPTQNYPPNRRPSPSNYVAFLIDGELNFMVPVWEKNTEGVYYLLQSHSVDPDWNRAGLSEADATRIAKGIAGP